MISTLTMNLPAKVIGGQPEGDPFQHGYEASLVKAGTDG
ncbi:hypothetical protein J2Y66_003650 [Paenarthrobacter nitroguajacolicus]|nr:hypothetical protein [Paenarthrobacter nitroguajacolicus]